MIGPLQSNKARDAVELFDVIQSLARESLAKELARELARARAGDVAAFGALVRRHQERVFRFLHRMLDAREEAMELSQDVFVKAWQALPGWRPEAAFSTWLLQIARNAALDQLRRRQVVRFAPLEEGLEVADEAPGPEAR